jgi:alkaline phosphatase
MVMAWNLGAVSRWAAAAAICVTCESACSAQDAADPLRSRQFSAIESGHATWGHWGGKPGTYSKWTNHSNRLIPVYTFGMTLGDFKGAASVYRNPRMLEAIYGYIPEQTVNAEAEYFDQTQIHTLQANAVAAGKKYIFLVIFDGMDWQTTQAAATYRLGLAGYSDGRGHGLHFLDYRTDVMDYGWMVTSPRTDRYELDIDAQTARNADDRRGGYDPALGGAMPWASHVVSDYLMGTFRHRLHVVTDSASSATSMTSGIKTYNAAINVDGDGRQVMPIARRLQADSGFAIGVVTSVPISHATPAAAYANNVSRDDYQDLTRDLIGRSSIAHRQPPLSGVDVLIGAGWGDVASEEARQGRNFVPGNRFLSDEDLAAIDCRNGGKYELAIRTPGREGSGHLREASQRAIAGQHRLLGFFGCAATGHLPYQTADGRFDPTRGVSRMEKYEPADLAENPTLEDMTNAALDVLAARSDRVWLMVEAGDVDWANHENNIDDSIGAVFSGDAAVAAITAWIDARGAWDDSLLIVTADHGHYFNLVDPAALFAPLPAPQ